MTTLEDRLAHQTLLDDDELAEGQFSLPKSLEFPGLEAAAAAAHDEVASPESADTVVISPREEVELVQPLHQQVEKLEPSLMQEPLEVFRSAPFPIPLKQRIHAPPPSSTRTATMPIPLQPKCAPPSKTPSPPDLVDFEEDGDEETSFAGKPASRSSSRASSSGAKRIPAKLKMKLERPVPSVKEPPPAVPPKPRKLKSGSKKVEVTSFVNNSFQVEVED